jgi:hypothetical protein
VIGPADTTGGVRRALNEVAVFHEFGHMTYDVSSGRRAAVTALARKHGCSTKYIYDLIERHKVMAYDK